MDKLTATALIAVSTYYLLIWALVGRDPQPGSIVVRYDPPQNLSPALLRQAWKQNFDDRSFWSVALSLVAKGFATMDSRNGAAVLHRAKEPPTPDDLPREENILWSELDGHHRKGMTMTMLDGRVSLAAYRMAEVVRKASEIWFRANQNYAIVGAVLSLVVVFLAARPQSLTEVMSLSFSLALMSPAAFYLVFLVLRIADLLRATRSFDGVLFRRLVALIAFVVPCLCSIGFGMAMIYFTWGISVVLITVAMVTLDLALWHFLKAPTAAGQNLLDEIQGFRTFLKSVERHPLDREEGPDRTVGAYERYLPYAVALEVEQAWSDRFIALASTEHHPEPQLGAESFYLGMWNGKPVEILYRPEPLKR